jgi:hypothetical protein
MRSAQPKSRNGSDGASATTCGRIAKLLGQDTNRPARGDSATARRVRNHHHEVSLDVDQQLLALMIESGPKCAASSDAYGIEYETVTAPGHETLRSVC